MHELAGDDDLIAFPGLECAGLGGGLAAREERRREEEAHDPGGAGEM
jgi:hypothetical protein